MKEIKDQFSLVGGPLKASTKSHILASTSDIYDEFWGTYQNVINEYNSNPLDAFLVQNKGIITEIINSTKIQTLTKTTLNEGDLCLGIYKDDTQTNSKYDYSKGEYLIPGYKSVYFTITEISNDYIAVSVETDEIKPNTIFVVIGNTKNGINFSLNTEDLKADFINVKAFKIVEDSIKNISGKFTYNGVSCEGTLLDKIYTSNSIEYLSNAPSLNSAFKSTVFTRNPDRPSVPTGGRYDNPIPVDVDADGKLIWSDGIPDGNAILWASTRIFSSDEKYPQQEVWTEPKQMTDTADFDVAFSSIEDNPGDPTNNKDNWANTADESTIWMATSTCKNGVWSAWQISKIKGEKGNDGTSISIQGSARKVDTLPTEQGSDKALLFTNHQYEGKTHPWIYLWNKTKWEAYSGNAGESYLVDGNLYVWDGDSWENAGSFKGDKGESAYIHIKYAQQDDEGEEVTLVDGSTIKLSFTDSNGDVPGLYLGLKPDNIVEDSENINDYTWAKWKGEDGFGYEYIYIGTADYTNPGVPKSASYNGKSPNDDDYVPEGWSDNPVKIDSKTKYCWMCHRQKVDGKWSNYKGVDDTWASLWAKWSEDGKGITSITRKYQVSNSTNKEDVINGMWSESSPAVNPENIYLWEWIHTEYSIGNPDDDYAIIGRMGEPGIDGKYNEYIYCLTKENKEPDLPNKKDNIGNDEGGWTDDPKSVSETLPYQWISEREYDPSKKEWGEYSTPVLWNIWAKGENSIHLDLDNQMDSMLYNDSGEPISSAVVTNPTLYDGITPVKNTDIVWELNTQEPTDYYTFDNTIGKLTVNGISADQNTVIYSIIANYKSAKYVASLTIKKLVGVDKYDLVITPNSFAFNITTETPSEEDCTIEVYRTDQNGNRGLVEKLDTGFSLNIDGFGSWQYGDTYEDEYYENGITFKPDWNKDYCRIQLLKNNIIIDTETIPINKSKDGVDGSAIRLDLSNENDSMLYDSAGTLLSGNVISTATLYNGTKIVPSSEYNLEIVSNGCVAELNVNTITVSSITTTSANVEVVAIYKEVPYVTNLNIKKLVGVDKYDLAITPNSIAYNTSTTELSSDTINIGVYRTSQSEGRKLVTNLSTFGLKLYISNFPNPDATQAYNNFNKTNTTSNSKFSPNITGYIANALDIKVILKDSNGVVLDAETIPINKSANGGPGEDAINVVLIPSSIILTQDPETNKIDFTNSISQVKLYKGQKEITTGFFIDDVIIDDDSNENTVEARSVGDDKVVIDGIVGNPTSGKIEVIVKYGDDTYSSILQYAINWVGTWSATIKNDVYKAVSQETFTYYENNQRITVNGISTIEQSAEGIKSDVEQIKTTQTSQRETISSIQQTADSLTTRISSVEDRQDAQDETISSIEQNIATISLQVNSYQESIDSHTESISQLTISKDGIDTRVATVENDIKTYSTQIQQTANDIDLTVQGLKDTGINIEEGTITLNSDNTIFNGNVQFNGLIVEATENYNKSYNVSGFIPIDMVNVSSVTATAGDLVLLPAQQTDYGDFKLSIGGGYNNINGYKPAQFFKAGAKLSITNPYDAEVSAWRLIQNNETYRTYLGNPVGNINADDIQAQYEREYKNLLSKAVLVVSDPRLFNGYGKSIGLLQEDGTFGGTTIVASDQYTARWGGLFSCGGAIGRLVLVLPGQSLKLTSSIVTLGKKEWLMWNVDNPEEFVPISKTVHLQHGWEEDGFENYEVVASNLWLNKYTPSMSVVASHSGTDANASMFGPKILCDTNSKTDYYEFIHIYLEEAFGNNTSGYYPKFEIV